MAKTTDQLYFDWMVKIVQGQDHIELLRLMNTISFSYTIPRDSNRFEDGVDLRYRFGNAYHIPDTQICNELDGKPCTVLEMMVALSIRLEESIMSDTQYGDRTYIWFKDMLKSLGVEHCVDGPRFPRGYCVEHIYRFLNHDYKPNGEGGLFTVNNGKDLRQVEIWCQAMWYLSSLYHY